MNKETEYSQSQIYRQQNQKPDAFSLNNNQKQNVTFVFVYCYSDVNNEILVDQT